MAVIQMVAICEHLVIMLDFDVHASANNVALDYTKEVSNSEIAHFQQNENVSFLSVQNTSNFI